MFSEFQWAGQSFPNMLNIPIVYFSIPRLYPPLPTDTVQSFNFLFLKCSFSLFFLLVHNHNIILNWTRIGGDHEEKEERDGKFVWLHEIIQICIWRSVWNGTSIKIILIHRVLYYSYGCYVKVHAHMHIYVLIYIHIIYKSLYIMYRSIYNVHIYNVCI